MGAFSDALIRYPDAIIKYSGKSTLRDGLAWLTLGRIVYHGRVALAFRASSNWSHGTHSHEKRAVSAFTCLLRLL